MNTAVHTVTGLRGWIGRKLEALSLEWTLRWLEEDIDRLGADLCAGPAILAQKRIDAAELRVRLALLRD